MTVQTISARWRRPAATATSIKSPDGIIDLIAVARRLAGDASVVLTREERQVAIHYGLHIGIPHNTLQAMLRMSGSTWMSEVKKQPPVDPASIHLPLVHSVGTPPAA